ncbi:glycosyl transferases group 1 domain-containing protein [Ditylenchus destructor]|uniref:Glycosyl transferases group 1 domain-containing protein n=1 Tax=Ditylenchus destructor TaxID=166010 RepID=A0AAD4QW70_9BILA|nr:glycosyl transferases group 1 domain-containing protein [Ditylenchus destructor]
MRYRNLHFGSAAAVALHNQDLTQHVIAVADRDYLYPSEVVFTIDQYHQLSYIEAANYINDNGYDCVVLEHEYGIFGGNSGRNKGIETVIESLAEVVKDEPDLLFLIVGKTHPNVLAHSGEEYRDYLKSLIDTYKLGEHVQFVNSFVSQSDLVTYLSACDVYVTPYVNEAQITSGTLSYAIGAGAAVVSTPYGMPKSCWLMAVASVPNFRQLRSNRAIAYTILGIAEYLHHQSNDEVMIELMRETGENDLKLGLYDEETKGCCDGLESYGINRNQGAESTLCFYLAYIIVYGAFIDSAQDSKIASSKSSRLIVA